MSSNYHTPPINLYDEPRVAIRPLLTKVYLWMTFGLFVTTVVSLLTLTIPLLRQVLFSPVFFAIVMAELLLVMFLSIRIHKMSFTAAALVFLAYAALNGFTLTGLLLAFSASSTVAAFSTASATFLAMTVVGATIQRDLSGMTRFFIMALIGLMAAMVINIFLGSSLMELLISVAGVVLFAALTAYDTQKIMRLSADPRIDGADADLVNRLSIMGALTLYLDFINLFIFLLRLFGRRR